MTIEKYSMGIGDRFEHQGSAQLAAFVEARKRGVEVVPVWNKSNREHLIIGTKPSNVRTEADSAVKELGWRHSYYVDADHVGIGNVDGFIEPSNYFTLDVADFIGKPPAADELARFVRRWKKYAGNIKVPRIEESFTVTEATIEDVGRKYLFAVREAGKTYRHIETRKGKGNFVTEVSMDETDAPQSPIELFFILGALAEESVPLQTIAPKFTGKFLKGVDYAGDLRRFEKEFEQDVAVIAFAAKEFSLPGNLKISVHSGSDKFSIYPAVNRTIRKLDAGLHLKTAGTTWLEEVIGLAKTGGNGLTMAKEIYAESYRRFDEFAKPYRTVIEIDAAKLPAPETVGRWSADDFVRALQHDRTCPSYNTSLRQLIHIGYKVAAEMGPRFLEALEGSKNTVAPGVTENLFTRHLEKIFLNGD